MMRSVQTWLSALAALLIGALILAGCSSPTVGANQSFDALPTPVPLPTNLPEAPTPVPAPAPGTGVGVPASGMLFSDDFARNTLSNWTIVDSTDALRVPSIWEISNGVVKQISDGNGNPAFYSTALVSGDPAWKDYTVTAAGYGTGNDDMGVVVRASAQGYYVFWVMSAASGGELALISRFDPATSSFEHLAKVPVSGFEDRRWYVLSLRVQGSSLQGFVDGVPVLAASDTVLTQGRAGVFGKAQGNLQFDNIVVSSLAAGQ